MAAGEHRPCGITECDLSLRVNPLLQLSWGVPVEAEPYADPGGRRARFRLLVSTCGLWIEWARGLLSARRWSAAPGREYPGRSCGGREV
jgi:hypothetical protein